MALLVPTRLLRLTLVAAFLWTGLQTSSIRAEPVENVPPAGKEEKDQDKPRIKITGWRFLNIFKENAVDLREPAFLGGGGGEGEPRHEVPAERLKAAKTLIDQQLQKFSADGSKNLDTIAEVFRQHPFEEIEKLAKVKELGLDSKAVQDMSLLRRQMIDQAMAQALEKIDPDKKLTIGMLDSGNKASGIASDVDQTVFVMPKDLVAKILKERGISESQLTGEVIKKFDVAFEALYKCKPARLGIESMNGADFFPDWRAEHNLAELHAEVNRVVDAKRQNPEAYRSEGQLKSQAEGRGNESLREHSERVEALDRINEAEKILQAAKTPEELARAQADLEKLTKETLEEYRKKKEFKSVENLEQLREEFKRHSPWTEVGWGGDPEAPRPEATRLANSRNKVLKIKPEFVKRFAFDGAWDNWIMFEAHAHNRRKYLLRSVAEGISLLRTLESGKTLSTYEYEAMYGKFLTEGKLEELDKFLKDVYPPLEGQLTTDKGHEARIERVKKVLAVAARERLRHKGYLKPDGTEFTEAEVWKEFSPELTEAEKRMYEGLNPEAKAKALDELKKTKAQWAIRGWEHEARALMVENLLRTISASTELMTGRLSDAEFSRLAAGQAGATREKLRQAVESSMFHGFHDLMSLEHAMARVEADPKTKAKINADRPRDLVDRLLAEIHRTGDPNLISKVEQIAREAAFARLMATPRGQLGEARSRYRSNAFYEYAKETLRPHLESMKEVYKEYNDGKYTQDYVAQRVLQASVERFASTYTEMLGSAGFNIKDVKLYIPIQGESKMPTFEIEFEGKKWEAKKLLSNMVSAGNADSALQVILAYQEGGSEAAQWALAREMVMNLPGVAQGTAIYELVAHGRPQGAIMAGSAMLIPGAGQAYIVVSIYTTSVAIVGNYYLQPLKNDLADSIYQGFIGKEERGWTDFFRPTFSADRISKRCNLLHRVALRAIPQVFTGKDGKEFTTLQTSRYSKDEALDLEFIPTTTNDDYDYLAGRGLLGGAAEWDELVAKTRADHRLSFEAQRASLYYHYEKQALDYLKKNAPDAELYREGEVFPHLAKMFRQTVEEWVTGTGSFDGFDENVQLSTRVDEQMRGRLAARLAQDFLRSFKILREGEKSKEKDIRGQCERALEERRGFEANQMMFAVVDGRSGNTDPALARALRRVIDARREECREAAPRIHVYPRVVTRMESPTTGSEVVEMIISTVANPEEYPPPYLPKEEPFFETRMVEELGRVAEVLKMRVTVFDSTGKQVGKPWEREIGVIGREFVPERPELKIARDKASNRPESVVVTAPNFPEASVVDILRAKRPEGPWTTVLRDGPKDRAFSDSYPVSLKGTNQWYYTTLPKAPHQVGREVKAPDTSRHSSIRLHLDLEPPKLKAEVMTSDAYYISIEKPEEKEKRLERERERDAGQKKAEEEARKGRTREEIEDWLAVQKREQETGEFNESRIVVLSWEEPELHGELKGSKDVTLALYRSERKEGPYRSIGSYTGYPRDPVRGFSVKSHEDTLPGLTYYYKARFQARTLSGEIYSDWVETSVAFPAIRVARANGGISAESYYARIRVGKGQQIQLECPIAVYGVSKYSDFKTYFQQHGPEGMDESTFQRYSQDKEKEFTEQFWKDRKDAIKRGAENVAELQQKLEVELKRRREQWHARIKAEAPLPAAALCAVIGRFTPLPLVKTEKPVEGATRPAGPQSQEIPRRTYFLIGKGVKFTAPDYGEVFVCGNWPRTGNEVERFEKIYTSIRYLNGSTQERPAPSVGVPEWTKMTAPDMPDNRYKVRLSFPWIPGPGETFEYLSAPSLDGPWYSHTDHRGEPFKTAPVEYNRSEILPGQRAFLRTRIRFVPDYAYLGEGWSYPVEIFRSPEPVAVPGLPNPRSLIFGLRGQSVKVKVAGQWNPVRFDGLKPHGPEGIPEDQFRELAGKMMEVEKALPEKEKQSNLFNLLGVTSETPGPSAKPVGGLKDAGYFLLNKGSFASKEHPAGCLLAYYRSAHVDEQFFVRNFMEKRQDREQVEKWMAVDTEWSFTFPEDGYLNFLPNLSSGWTGSHYFAGGGELTLALTLSEAPEESNGQTGSFKRALPASVSTATANGVQNSGTVPNASSSSGDTPFSTRPQAGAVPPAAIPAQASPDTAPDSAPVAASIQPGRETPGATGSGVSSVSPPVRPDSPSAGGGEGAPPTAPVIGTSPPAAGVRIEPPSPGNAVRPPSTTEVAKAQDLIQDGSRLFQEGKVKESLARYQEAVKAAPSDVSAWAGLGMAQNAQGQHAAAIETYRKALQLDGGLAGAGAWIGENYLAMNDIPQARTWFQWELNRDPKSAWSLSFLGTIESMEGRQDSANTFFTRAAAADPNVAAQRYQNAAFLAQNGKHQRALWEYTAAMSLNPRLYQAYFGLGASYAALGQNGAAIQNYNFYLQFESTGDWAAQARREIQRIGTQR
ncbi:MAG: tetratricopeptide repeat protein [Planctomycetota bacterium]|nr:tetratricopeptide repeat protein [Planctomycetota bacterium]